MAIPVQKEPVGHRRVKNQFSEVVRESIAKGEAVPISNRGEIEGYLVPPEAMEELDRAERMREMLPLLIAAAAAGAALPSRTLRDLGIEIPFDWKALNRFTARAPVTFSVGEDGEPWLAYPRAEPVPTQEDPADFDL